MASGVFGLRKVYKKQVENVTNNNFVSWPEGATYGYFGGGSLYSTVDRIDFSNETTSLPGNNLPQARSLLATVSSDSYGYFGGGFEPPTIVAIVDRIDFSNETFSSPGNNLPQARYALAGTSSNSYGYFGGGLSAPTTRVAIISRIDFSTETASSATNNLTTSVDSLAGTSSNSYGYFGGGLSAPTTRVNTIERLDLSNETINSNPNRILTESRSGLKAVSSDSYGYFGGGFNPTNYVDTVDRIDFINETTSAPGNDLTTLRHNLGATSSNSYGYFGGGNLPTVSSIDRIDFSNEVVSVITNSLSQARFSLAGVSGGASVARANGYGTYGYHGGGFSNVTATEITKHDFSTNSFSDIGNLDGQRWGIDRSAYNNFYGYFGGGYGQIAPSPYAVRSKVYRLDFSNESLRTLPNNLPLETQKLTHTSTAEVGYFTGGVSAGTYHCRIYRIDFSNENISTLPLSSKLSFGKASVSSVKTPQYAFFGGGYRLSPSPAGYSKIDRMDFSTELTSAYTNMTRMRYDFTGIESKTYGYFWGGFGDGALPYFYYSDFEKLQFSNGTSTNFPNSISPLYTYLNQNSQTDSYYGYFFGGGFQPYPFGGSFGETLVRRLDFSSDTVAILPPNIPRKSSHAFSMSNKY